MTSEPWQHMNSSQGSSDMGLCPRSMAGGCAEGGAPGEARPHARVGGSWAGAPALRDPCLSSIGLFSSKALNSLGDPGLRIILGSHYSTCRFPKGPDSVKRTVSFWLALLHAKLLAIPASPCAVNLSLVSYVALLDSPRKS